MIAGILVLLALAFRSSWKHIRRLKGRLGERRERNAESEKRFFEMFRKASLSGDSRATMRSLMFWLDSTEALRPTATLDELARSSGDKIVESQTQTLQSRIYGPAGKGTNEWSSRFFFKAVAGVRGRLRKRGNDSEDLKSFLPPLNPSGRG